MITIPEGKVIADTAPQPIFGVNIASENWYRDVSNSWSPYVSNIYPAMPAQIGKVIAVAVPITNHTVFGILVLQINPEKFANWTKKEIKIEQNASPFLTDQNGEWFGNPPSFLLPIDIEKLQKEEVDLTKKMLVIHQNIPSFPFGLVLAQPASDAFKNRDQFMRRFHFMRFFSSSFHGSFFVPWVMFCYSSRKPKGKLKRSQKSKLISHQWSLMNCVLH